MDWEYEEYYYPEYKDGLIATQEVFEEDAEFTGLLDQYGSPIFKDKQKIGFI